MSQLDGNMEVLNSGRQKPGLKITTGGENEDTLTFLNHYVLYNPPRWIRTFVPTTQLILADNKIQDYEFEDIEDVLRKLETSFEIRFIGHPFQGVKTFGELCDVIEDHIHQKDLDDCTSQQAFYLLRKNLAETLRIEQRSIAPESSLKLFCRVQPGEKKW